MIAHKQKKTKKKRAWASGQLSTDVTTSEMGLKSLSSNSIFDPDYIKELVNDIRKFSHMLLYLKEAIFSDCFREVIHIRLEELLCVLKSIMNKHQNLNSVDLQNAAEMLTAKVKAVNFTEVNEENKNDLFQEVFSSIETLAFTFGNILTNFLMGDVGNDSLLRLPVSRETKSFENVSVESVDSSSEKGNFSPLELDNVLLKNTDSIELALSYAKTWSKYTKNIVSWVEKKLNLELESTRNVVKLAEATRTNIGIQEFMPLQSLFTNALLNDIESSHLLQQTIAALQANKFVQPLLGRKNEMEKQRKEIKELWKQEQNKMLEAENALKKAKLLCMQRQDEYEKAKSSMFRAEEEHLSSSGGLAKNLNKQLEKKRRLEEEALQKVEEANELYKVCVTNVEERRNDLENTKREILTQLRTLVFQCDLTLKAVTVNLFHMQHLQAASLADSLQSLCDSAKLYDPGQEYSEFVKATNSTEEEKVDGNVNKHLNSSQPSGFGPANSLEDVVRLPDSSNKIEEDRCSNSADITGPSFIRSWTFGMFSDSESTGGSSESRSLDSESISPGDFHRKLPRTPSSGTMSSADDLDEREPPSPSETGPNSLGTFKKTLMSKAALTHKFRKLRSPTKCRDCEGIVVFQGVECEECLLVCHRKCLENLVIICGHQKLTGKIHLFGAEFTQVAKKEPDGIPFILKICASEIENRALCLQGIYRVCGNKIKTEKLCQALENGMHLVDISEFSSHDICDVLKLYLRQLPEPFILFRLYKEFIDLAKEIQHVNEEQETKKDSLEDKKWPNMCIEINRILIKSKDLLRQLPASNFNSLHFLIVHLKRVVDHAEENKMNSKNLGVIFGPSLIRPRPTTAPITISSLAEYSNQARLVEFLITYSQKIFDGSLQPQDVMCSIGGVSPQVDQGGFPKPLLSPEERDIERSMKSLFFSSKEDIHTSESESKIFERATSFEESERKQNALEKCDACLSDKAQLLLDQEVESASQKTEDGKTPKPLSLKSDRSTNNVERHTPRTKIRPVSLPVDRLLLASPPNERNGRNMGNVNLDKFCKNPAFEGVNRKDTATTVCSKFNGFDQQTLQKIQDKQYEQNSLTAKTTMIMPSALQEKGVTTSLQISGDHSVNATQPSKPYAEPVRSVREACERRSSDSYPLAPVRAPRTLQPQHWTTFYKPHAPTISIRGNEEKPASPSAAVPPGTAHDPQSLMVKSMPDPDKASACPGQATGQPKEDSEELGLPDVNPTCQRPRLKRMQQFEDLEDEIPQFV
ncbi:rho GTPase-activating protein 29 isoform X2 [Pongo pygmaeus]|uniref:Rho GTPase-activating protein 29 n=1 Tax=Pongo abelii TaxID=9601 RepID=A0A2J8VCU6_PONAB|nr:rho GTPase-activating protein 29 isoform X2 [Pongo abelii]XP_024089023.1 rho GTPase-activating protein 29 isoform X2 [Pongo abelii]XP_054331769.1 rho GTPase-activating protein 29 isoform X2 [Pongo pygmaeus]XP_054331774.1 rho GTPase-activating protein 29 isoform X2 [Pongo pygmaeus]XP_054331782.1 rho GTPase-activating protein 29 isoform X2 [Pongo pygmaeus]PNJ55327.1 ARHGAP29 isoform 3 [Pongo abelii]